MQKGNAIGIIILVITWGIAACKKDWNVLADNNPTIQPTIPAHFSKPAYSFSGNPLTKEGVALGKKLFFDPILSRDRSISCGSCHLPEYAFSDPGMPVSKGIEGRNGVRNTPALTNLIWYPYFNWDGGINHIEVQPVAPITDSNEMDNALSNVLQALRSDPAYSEHFRRAFGSDSIYDQVLLYALAQFMATIVSHRSPYDDFIGGKGLLSNAALRGKTIFETHCANCHSGVLQTDFSFRQNGLRTGSPDRGRATITNRTEDQGRFRVPSLRNVALTAPYMHDGKIATLEDVIEAYNSDIVNPGNLDTLLPEGGFGFTDNEKTDLKAFLLSLTDEALISDIRFKP